MSSFNAFASDEDNEIGLLACKTLIILKEKYKAREDKLLIALEEEVRDRGYIITVEEIV